MGMCGTWSLPAAWEARRWMNCMPSWSSTSEADSTCPSNLDSASAGALTLPFTCWMVKRYPDSSATQRAIKELEDFNKFKKSKTAVSVRTRKGLNNKSKLNFLVAYTNESNSPLFEL